MHATLILLLEIVKYLNRKPLILELKLESMEKPFSVGKFKEIGFKLTFK